MSDDSPTLPPPIINKTLQALVAGITLLASAWGVLWLNLWGRPENLLHQSTLSWCFTLIGLTLMAFGLAPALPAIIQAVKR